jgi:hypothetical protein
MVILEKSTRIRPHKLGNGYFLSQNRGLRGDQIVVPFRHGSTADRLRNFGNPGLHAGLRSEYLQTQKDNISGETNHRKSGKEIRGPTKERQYKFQCYFRIAPEISHEITASCSGCACGGWRFRPMLAEVNRGRLEVFSLLSIAVTVCVDWTNSAVLCAR